MDIRTILYLILGMPICVQVAVASSPTALTRQHRRQLPHARSLRSSSSLPRRSPPSTAPSSISFFVPSTAKLPLTALATRNDRNADLHPQVLLQQHVNRAVKRQARMKKRAINEAELAHKLMKRWESVQPAAVLADSPNSSRVNKRWRGGEALAGATAAVQHMKDRVASIMSSGLKSGGKLGSGSGGLATAVSARVGVSGYAGASVAAQVAAKKTNGTSTGGDEAEEEKSQGGYSQAELDAAVNNTVMAPEPVTAANSLGLAIEANDVGYFADVQLGSNNQTFRILMDSGSADFWVPSTACTDCGNHTSIGYSTSSTFTDTAIPWSVTYGTGNVAGTTVADDAVIAGLTVKQLMFGAVTEESDDFSDPSVPFDGLMGLALSSLSSQSVPTPIERLASDGLVLSPQMGYKLGRVADGKNDGEVTFGGVDGGKYKGGLAVVENVSKQGFWSAPLLSLSIDNLTLPFSSSSGSTTRSAILDTGTTLIIAPPADAEAVHRAIPGAKPDGQGGFTLPCTTTSILSLTFPLLSPSSSNSSSITLPMRPSDLTFLPLTDDLEGECVSSISAGEVGGRGEWLVGAAFLKNVYFATDVEANVIGLAPLAD
ncbi:hypothetical protein JCM8097_001403 [Rhodosporidiobolus ruineniae]